MIDNQEFFTVSDINNFIKDVMSAGFPRSLWICGEIQGFNRNKFKSHIFFELIEKDKDTKDVKSKIGLVIFANRKNYVEQTLSNCQNPFQLKDDIEVKFLCKIDYYVPHGVVRLVVEDIDPNYTLGKLAIEKQKLIKLLKESGVLDKNKQLELPEVPLSIGLVTSDDSAAYNDFISELQKSRFGFKVFVKNTIMQGKNCEVDVCRSLDQLSALKELDVIVITRGGGSIADLSCFDSKMIAEKIASLSIPVLSGIGHEIDLAITDLAAHTYAKTPTAIAQFLVERIITYLEKIDSCKDSLLDLSEQMIKDARSKLTSIVLSLSNNSRKYFSDNHKQLITFEQILRQKSIFLLSSKVNEIEQIREKLKITLKTKINFYKDKLNGYNRIISISDPKNTVKRGFSITRSKDGKIIRNIKDVDVNQEIFTEVNDGNIKSRVEGN